MRRRAGSWKFGRTAEYPVEARRRTGASPSPGARLHGVAALIALAHAVLIAAAWQSAPLRERIGERRLSMRLVSPAPARQVAVVAPSELAARPAPAIKATATAVARTPRPAPPEPEAAAPIEPPRTALQPTPSTAEPITGVALAIPRIGLPGTASAGWGKPPAAITEPAAPPPMAMLAQATQAHAAREAGRAQILDALQRTLADASQAIVDGACALAVDAPAHLACDNDVLMQALAPREAALSGFLRAYRSMEPRTRGLAIAVVGGRTQVSWNLDGEVR